MRKKSFTLIELIAVIFILAALTAIVYAMVMNFKDEAIKSSVEANIRNLQMATDKYMADNDGKQPSNVPPNLGDPQLIDYDKLYPKYIKKKPDTKIAFYWIDFQGQVWGSTISGPDKIYEKDNSLIWEDTQKSSFKIFEHIKEVGMSSFVDKVLAKASLQVPYREVPNAKITKSNNIYEFKKQTNTHYYVQGIDYLGLPTPLFNPNYQGYPIKDDFGNFLPLVKGGTYYFTTNAQEQARWLGVEKSESKPTGTDILYEFSTSNDGRNFTAFTKDFYSLPDSQYIKVKVTLVPSKDGKTPTLNRLKVKFKTIRELEALGIISTAKTPITSNVYEFDDIVLYDHFAGEYKTPSSTPFTGAGGSSSSPSTPIVNSKPSGGGGYTGDDYVFDRGSDFYTINSEKTYGSFSKTFYTGGPILSFSELIANTSIPKGSEIVYSYQSSIDGVNFSEPVLDIQDVPNGKYLKVNVEMSRDSVDTEPPVISDMIVVFNPPQSSETKLPDSVLDELNNGGGSTGGSGTGSTGGTSGSGGSGSTGGTGGTGTTSPAESDWITVSELFYMVDAEETGDWTSVEVFDNQPSNTRILYIYSTSNDGENWENHTLDFNKVPNSRYLNVQILLQVLPVAEKAPTFYEIIVNYKVNDQTKSKVISGLNRDLIQKAVDRYYADNKEYPTFEQPVIYVPDTIYFTKLYPEYLDIKYEAEGAYYWVDYRGKVWISSIDSPKNLSSLNRIFTWDAVEGASFYKIYAEVDGKFVFVKDVEGTKYNIPDANEKYFVSSVDSQGNISAPVGVGYEGYSGNCNVYGNGSKENPFVVCSEETFNNIRNDLYANYILTRNLDFKNFEEDFGSTFKPLGNTGVRFYGTFDGQGYTISNLIIDENTHYVGLFSQTNTNSVVKNLKLENVKVKGLNYTGLLVGRNYGILENIQAQGEVIGGSYVGGLSGNSNATIINSTFDGIVNGASYIGGISGYSNGKIEKSSAKVDVKGTSNYVGGIAGYQSQPTAFLYSYGNIEGQDYVGGLFGQHYNHPIKQSFSISHVKGNSITGGITGHKYGSEIRDTFHIGSIQANIDAGGIVGIMDNSAQLHSSYARTKVNTGTRTAALVGRLNSGSLNSSYWDSYYSTQLFGLSDQVVSTIYPSNIVQMMKENTYKNWDFVSIWKIEESTTLPYLQGLPKLKEIIGETLPSDYEPFSSGSGTVENPYVITSEVQLFNVRYEPNAHYILGKDLDLSMYKEEGWKPIGIPSLPFAGTFDGKGHTINNLTINNSSPYNGLFGYTATNSFIKNLKLTNTSIKGGSYTGSLVGYSNSTLEDIEVSGNISGSSYVGGVVGRTFKPLTNTKAIVDVIGTSTYVGAIVGHTNSTITDVIAEGTVKGIDNVGGIAGTITGKLLNATSKSSVEGRSYVGGVTGSSSNIEKSNAIGSVIATGDYVGGLSGQSTGTVLDSFTTGNTTGVKYTGGLVGYSAHISNSYATGTVTGTQYVGGLTGQSTGNIQIAYSLGKTTGTDYIGGIAGYKSSGMIENTFSLSELKGNTQVGGLLGRSENATVTNSYSKQNIEAPEMGVNVTNGGLIGSESGTTVNNSYWDSHSSGFVTTASRKGIALSTISMFTQEEFEGWDFNSIWNKDTDTIPYLEGLPKPENALKENIEISFKGFSSGLGTLSDPYVIETEEQLDNVRYQLEGYYLLGEDMNLSSFENWKPIGDNYRIFLGSLDGQNHTISNLTINDTNLNYAGLFGYSNGNFFKNIKFVGVNVTAKSYVGALTGVSTNNLENIYVTGNVTSVNNYTGLIAGHSTKPAKELQAEGKVKGLNYSGGLIGFLTSSIETSTFKGEVTGNDYTGGLAGRISSTIKTSNTEAIVNGKTYTGGLTGLASNTVTDSYSQSTVNGESYTGGLIGQANSTVSNSNSKGTVKGLDNTGGLIGYSSGQIRNSYSWSNVNGRNTVGGLTGYSDNLLDTVYAIGNVVAERETGGLVGYKNGGNINYAFATGPVKGTTVVGGLVGQLTNATVSQTYSIKEVVGSNPVGGLISQSLNSSTQNSYWDSYMSGQLKSQGGVGSNTQSMLQQRRYTSWDFANKWAIDESESTPYLKGLDKPKEVLKTDINSDFEYFSGGNGTTGNPYIIENQNQLHNMRYELDSHYKVIQDITLSDFQSGSGWLPVGDNITPFLGSFDGQEHTIKDLFINRTTNNSGLFGQTSSGASLKNIHLEGVDIQGSSYIGALAGYNLANTQNVTMKGTIKGSSYLGSIAGYTNGTLTNVKVTSNIQGTSSYIGGIAGQSTAPITNVEANTTISGLNFVGGIVGQTSQSIKESHASGSITSGQDYVGGITGQTTHVIQDSYSLMDVAGNDQVGGLAGYSNSNITLSYSEGFIKGNSKVGGIVGYKNSSLIENTFALGTVEGNNKVGGVVGHIQNAKLSDSFARTRLKATTEKGGLVGLRESSTIEYSYWDSAHAKYWKSEGGINSQIYSMIQQRRYTTWDFTGVWNMEEGKSLPYLKHLPIPEQLYFDKAENDMLAFVDGKGTSIEPYQIENEEQLNNIRWEMDSHYLIINDIELTKFQTGTGFEPIGDNHTPFRGTLEGQNHKVSNLYINTTNSYVGLFGETTNTVSIQNLELINANVKGFDFTAAIAGNNYGKLHHIIANGSVDGNSNVGGIAGWSNNQITKVVSNGKVSGVGTVGGLIGYSKANISHSYSTSDVNSSGTATGGLVGRQDTGSIENTFALGEVNGATEVGGLVGNLQSSSVTNSYSKSSSVKAVTTVVGGLIGVNTSSNVQSSYWDAYTSGQTGSAGGLGLNTIYLFKQQRFTGWDFDNVWTMTEDQSMPHLRELPVPNKVLRENVTVDFLGFESGWGSVNDPYLIKNEEQLAYVPYELTAHYRIVDNITVNEFEHKYKPIGTNIVPFTGYFDGENHTIDDLDMTATNYTGLFGYIQTNATVKNIKFTNANISGGSNVGVLAGYSNGIVENIHVQGEVAGASYVGGIIGRSNSVIANMTSDIKVSATGSYSGGVTGYSTKEIHDVSVKADINSTTGHIGGITGYSTQPIYNAEVHASISSKANYVGGIAGYSTSSIKDSNSDIALAISSSYVGGIAGYSSGIVDNVDSIVNITGTGSYVGGITGNNTNTITKSFAKGTISLPSSGNYVGGISGYSQGAVTYSDSEVEIITAGRYVGGAVGLTNQAIQYVTSKGNITSTQDRVGGIAGETSATILSSSSEGNVTSTHDYVGGIAGLSGSSISNSTSNGEINGYSYVGGIAGNVSSISDSHSKGNINGKQYVGGVAGYSNSNVSNSSSNGDVIAANSFFGGVVGQSNGNISNSYSIGKVTGQSYGGGIVGYTYGSIYSSYSYGNITGESYIGGLTGHMFRYQSESYCYRTERRYNYNTGYYYYACVEYRTREVFNINNYIQNSFAFGDVKGNSIVGGLVGYMKKVSMSSNYHYGTVTGTSGVSPLVVSQEYSSISSNNYWDKTHNSSSTYGTGLTETQMKTKSSFSGWDFTNTWAIEAGISQPYLKNLENPYKPSIDAYYEEQARLEAERLAQEAAQTETTSDTSTPVDAETTTP